MVDKISWTEPLDSERGAVAAVAGTSALAAGREADARVRLRGE